MLLKIIIKRRHAMQYDIEVILTFSPDDMARHENENLKQHRINRRTTKFAKTNTLFNPTDVYIIEFTAILPYLLQLKHASDANILARITLNSKIYIDAHGTNPDKDVQDAYEYIYALLAHKFLT